MRKRNNHTLYLMKKNIAKISSNIRKSLRPYFKEIFIFFGRKKYKFCFNTSWYDSFLYQPLDKAVNKVFNDNVKLLFEKE